MPTKVALPVRGDGPVAITARAAPTRLPDYKQRRG